MQRIYIFLLEMPTALLMVEISPSTKTELVNIGLIVAVRIAFHYFEKYFPKVTGIFKKKEVK